MFIVLPGALLVYSYRPNIYRSTFLSAQPDTFLYSVIICLILIAVRHGLVQGSNHELTVSH